MSKVGIITFQDGINFGAFLQVFSLKRAIESIGHEVAVVNYRPPWCWFREHVHILRYKLDVVNNYRKIRRFHSLQREHLNLTRFSFSIGSQPKGFDVMVYGSDEIWNTENPGFGYNPVYFGEGVSNRKVAYAPSFGSAGAASRHVDDAARLIREFSRLSVRDVNSRDLIREKIGVEVPIVPDPTFLVDHLSFVRMPEVARKYLLVYSATRIDDAHSAAIRAHADEEGLEIVSVGFECDFADRCVVHIDPFEWLGYVAGAEAVVTTMFHGTIFSLLFRRKLAILMTPYRINKFSALIERLGIQSLIWEEGPLAFQAYAIDAALAEFRESGLNYLRRNLSEALA